MPLVTIAAVLAAVLLHAVPGAAELLIFDRSAIAEGDGWRVITGNWIHYSPSHLAMDAGGLLLGGWMVERRSRSLAAVCIVGGALVVGIGVFGFARDLERFGGLSGIVVAVLLLAALLETFTEVGKRVAGAILLAAVMIKLVMELGSERTMLTGSGDTIIIARMSHLVGAAYALGLFVAWTVLKRRRVVLALAFPIVALSGCAASFMSSTATRGAYAAHVIRGAEPDSNYAQDTVTLELPLKVGVVFAADRRPGRAGATARNLVDSELSEAEKTGVTESLATSLRASPLVASAEALPPLESNGAAKQLRARSPDVLVIIGYDQTQRVRDAFTAPLSLISLVGLAGGLGTDTSDTRQLYAFTGMFLGAFALTWVAPSQRFETTTVLEAVAYHQRSGRVLFRAPSVVTRRRISTVIGMRGASREAWQEGVARSTKGLEAELLRRLVEFEKHARSSPEEFRIVEGESAR